MLAARTATQVTIAAAQIQPGVSRLRQNAQAAAQQPDHHLQAGQQEGRDDGIERRDVLLVIAGGRVHVRGAAIGGWASSPALSRSSSPALRPTSKIWSRAPAYSSAVLRCSIIRGGFCGSAARRFR